MKWTKGGGGAEMHPRGSLPSGWKRLPHSRACQGLWKVVSKKQQIWRPAEGRDDHPTIQAVKLTSAVPRTATQPSLAKGMHRARRAGGRGGDVCARVCVCACLCICVHVSTGEGNRLEVVEYRKTVG